MSGLTANVGTAIKEKNRDRQKVLQRETRAIKRNMKRVGRKPVKYVVGRSENG
jgi:hypothetical protein